LPVKIGMPDAAPHAFLTFIEKWRKRENAAVVMRRGGIPREDASVPFA
jgi:hypothetical protein